MNIDKDILQANPYLEEDSIIVGYVGSISHGTQVPSTDPDCIDDKDVMAVVIPPLNHYFGLTEFGSRGTKEIKKGEWDIVTYEFRKFVNLLIKGNPNVLGLLWLPDNMYLKVSDSGDFLIENRKMFATKQVYHSFTGYAYGQLKRMTHFVFEGYMGTKRKELVERYGYDCKNAAHLIRLLRMGIEFLNEGELYVSRSNKDAQQLMEIKKGGWTLEQVKEEADRLFKRAEEAYDRSTLPAKPDKEAVEGLCMKILYNKLIYEYFENEIPFHR